MPKHVVLMVPVHGGTLWRDARKVRECSSAEYLVDVILPSDVKHGHTCDVFMCMWWQDAIQLDDSIPLDRRALLVTDHYSWSTGDGPRQFKQALSRVSAVGVLCNRIRQDLLNHGFDLPRRTYVTPVGVDLELFQGGKMPIIPFTVGWLGETRNPRLAEQKGVHILQEATQLAGVRFKVQDGTRNPMPHEKVPGWMKTIHVLGCASEAEGGPEPILEAAAASRVLVSTRVGVVDEVISHRHSGLLVDRSARAFADAFLWLKANLALCQPMGMKAREQVARFSWAPNRGSVLGWQRLFDSIGVASPELEHFTPTVQSPRAHTPAEVEPTPPPVLPDVPVVREVSPAGPYLEPPLPRQMPVPPGLVQSMSKEAMAEVRRNYTKLCERPERKLHLGCGPKRLHGYVNVDVSPGPAVDIRSDILTFPLPPGRFQEIYSSHFLEHVFPEDTTPLLKRWFEALRPGGVLRLSVPDLRLILLNTVEGHAFGSDPNPPLFGDFRRAAKPEDRHRQTFTRENLTAALRVAGFESVRAWRSIDVPEIHGIRDWASYETISLNLLGVKSGGTEGELGRALPPTKPLTLSIITGTFNRLKSLQRLIAGVRHNLTNLPATTWEFVLADGGSTDGTREWVGEQVDCRLLDGGLEGAIPAFNLAYRASWGELVFQVNDDVEIEGLSLAKAVEFLMDPANSGVAQVCFDYNRTGHIAGNAPLMYEGAPHPNVAITRRVALEDVVARIGDFWGDAAHRSDETYGGDTLQGVTLKTGGWVSTYVPGVRVLDHHNDEQDALHKRNAATVRSGAHWGNFRNLVASVKAGTQDWPDLYVPSPGMLPRRSPVSAGPPERLLLLPLATAAEPQVGLIQAWARVGPTRSVSRYMGHLAGATNEVRLAAVMRAAVEHQPTVVWIQLQREGEFGEGELTKLREVCPPNCLLCTWNGDARTFWAQELPGWMVESGRAADLALHSTITYARMLRALGVEGAGYLQVGYEEGRDTDLSPDWTPPVDVSRAAVLTANRLINRPDRRLERMIELNGKFPGRLAVFGQGWGTQPYAHGPLRREFCPTLYALAPVTISTSISTDLEGYSSDRLARLGAAGSFVALEKFRGQEHWGVRDGHNVVCWEGMDELERLIWHWTQPEQSELRRVIRGNIRNLAQEWWSWHAVVEQFLAIVRAHRFCNPDKRI